MDSTLIPVILEFLYNAVIELFIRNTLENI
jgi:hypothetical protein